MKKKTKSIIFIIIFLLLICTFIYLKNRSMSYEVEYTINQYEIKEIYNKNEKTYTFYITYNNYTYPYKIYNDYLKIKEIIDNVDIYTKENELCIVPKSSELNFYSLCKNDDDFITYNLSNVIVDDYTIKEYEKDKLEHDKLTISYLNNKTYLLYNYKGFYYVDKNGIDNIEIFNKDVYSIDLIYQYNHFLIIPDYNQNHYFNKIYLINMENGKLDEIDFDGEISFNSIFLGDHKNNVYLLDKKEEKEYKINIKKKEIEETDFVILKDNKLQKTTYKDITKNNLLFESNTPSYYQIIDNKIYQVIDEYKILISNKEIDKIIKEDKDTIYYLSNNDLYMHHNSYGEVLLMSNFEWNFNNNNMIFID